MNWVIDQKFGGSRRLGWVGLLIGAAVFIGWNIAHEKWLLLASVGAIPFLALWPVPLALGAFVILVPFDVVAARLPTGMSEAAWDVIRPNLSTIAEAGDWWRIVTGPVDIVSPTFEDAAYLHTAAAIAADLDWAAEPWRTLTSALKAETNRNGKALFMPLRLALTGRGHGPDMAALLPLIGREQALLRLGMAGAASAQDVA